MILSVPIQLFIEAQQEGFKNELSFFLLLKLTYPEGKTKLTSEDLFILEFTHEIRTGKTTRKYLQKLIELGFITYNPKTQYYILKGFNRLLKDQSFETRLAFPIGFHNYNNLNAVTGAIIYGYLHKDFWRKVKREKSVQIKGCTYHFQKYNFDYRRSLAPVSVFGVEQIFSISPATATRLKQAARKERYLRVKKDYRQISNDEAATLQANRETRDLRKRKGVYYLQSIDLICPLFYFKKRRKLK